MDLLNAADAAASPLGRLNAGTKLVLAVVMTVVFLLSADWVTNGTGLVLLVAAAAATRMAPGRLAVRLWPVLAAALLSGWATVLLAEKTGRVLVHTGPLVLSTGVLAAGAAIALRGATLALVSVLLLLSTDAGALGQSLARTFRLPARMVLAAVAAFRLVGLMLAEWQVLAAARRARGLGEARGPISWLRGFGGQAFALMVQSLRRATRLATTMEARGFGPGPRTWVSPQRFGRADAVALVLGLALPGAAVAVSCLAGTYRFIF